MNVENKLLKAYLATSGYTVIAIENAILDLKGAIENTENIGLISIYQESLEKLEDNLTIINKMEI